MAGIFKNSKLWNSLIGGPDEYSMEQRAFHYVCLITGGLLLFSIVFDLYISQFIMSVVLTVLLLALSVLYYFSRFKEYNKVSVFLFVVSNYVALAINFFLNDGIDGPTICLSLITLLFIGVVTNHIYHRLFISLHVILIASLLSIQFLYPESVPSNYTDRLSRFLDWGCTGIITLVFVYAVPNFLRQYYDEKRHLADERARAIAEQNKVLEKVNEEKNKIFSIISHDLKSPLDSIQDYLVLMSEYSIDEADRINIQRELLEQTRYTSDLLNNLMQWARSQVNGIKPLFVGIVLSDFLQEIVSRKNTLAQKKNITITTAVDKEIVVSCDFDLMQIVVRNLINNAVKFTPNGGSISISSAIMENEGVISVRDSGIGIAPDKQVDLFTLRTRSTYGTNNEKGIGIGLFICHEFMIAQNGKIWVESQQGAGSTFYISLPLASPQHSIHSIS